MATYEELIKQGYQQSSKVSDYEKKLNEAMANRPSGYTSQYSSQLGDLYQQITNRKPFQYNLGTDALYQQYANQYAKLGNRAMQDTIGQTAALTGGYGNTYSQNAGQQAYQQYLSQLNDKVPELAMLARQNYDADTETLYNKYNLTKSADDTDYGRYRDKVADWQADVNLYNSLFNNERNFDYSMYGDNISRLMALAKGSGGSGVRYVRDGGDDSSNPYGNTTEANMTDIAGMIKTMTSNAVSAGLSYNAIRDTADKYIMANAKFADKEGAIQYAHDVLDNNVK